MPIEFAPVQPDDLTELLSFAFCAGANLIHPGHFDDVTKARWEEYVASPAPRSTFQRVSHAIEEQIKADDQWITWPGTSGCPLGLHVRHKRRYRDGQESGHYTTLKQSGDHHWWHTGSNADIVAYKLEPIEERQFKAKQNAKKLLVERGFASDLEDANRLMGE